jgi:tripartite-type tricarboxylate transporter receptor subunit TctC
MAADPAFSADPYPQKNKSLTLLLGASAGGSTDVGARLLAVPLERELGIKVQVENKPGAGWQIGMTALARAPKDGYTIGFLILPQVPATYLDPDRRAVFSRQSFQPLAMQVVDPGAIAVRADSPIKTIADLVKAAKENPGKLKASSNGILSDDHLAVLQFQRLTGTKFAIVQFDGSAPSMTALLGKHTDVYFGNIGDALPQARAGEVRILAIMDSEENKFTPGVPTLQSLGIKLHSSSSRGLVAPAGVPKEIVAVLTEALKKAINDETHVAKMEQQGLTLRYMDPDRFATYWSETEEQIKPLMAEAKQK